MPRDIRAGSAFIEITTKNGKLRKGLREASRQIGNFANSARRTASALVGIGTAIVAPLALAVRTFAKVGDELDKTAARTGIAVDSLTQFGFAAEQTGSDLATFEKGVQRLSRSIFDASRNQATAVDAFAKIGLTFADLAALSPEEQFLKVSAGLRQIESASERSAIAQQLLGRAGTRLLPLIALQTEELEALREQSDELGRTFGRDTATKAAALTDAFNRLTKAVQAFAVNVGGSLSEDLKRIADNITQAAAAAGAWVRENGKFIRGLAKLGGVIVAAGGAIGGLALGAGALSAVLGLLAAGPLATLPLLIGAVVVALGSLVIAFNGGRLAGIDFGRAIRRLADDLGLIEDIALQLEDAQQAFRRTTQEAKKLRQELKKAEESGDLRGQLRAQEQLIQAIEQQIEARARLREADAKQTLELVSAGTASEDQVLGQVLADDQRADRQIRQLESYREELLGTVESLRVEVAALPPVELPDVEIPDTSSSVDNAAKRIATQFANSLRANAQRLVDFAEFRFELARLNATDLGRQVLDDQRRIAELKAEARRLGALTEDVERQIEEGVTGDRLRQLEASVQVEAQTALGTGGTFDARVVGSLAGGVTDYQKRTAEASEQAAEYLEQLTATGALLRFN